MKTVIVVDDEEDARSLLKYYLSQHKELSLIGEATNGVEAVRMVNRLCPDIIFLDVQMPGLNGFEVLAQLDEIPEVVFSTAYDHYAIKAFEVHAVDYLLKPYGQNRFENAVSRILKNQDKLSSLAEALLTKETESPTRIIVHKGTRKIVINISEIIYGEAYGDYTKVFTKNEEFLSVKGISVFLESVRSDIFIRLHRSSFVNKNEITELKKTDRYYYALLSDGVSVKISDAYLPEIKKILF